MNATEKLEMQVTEGADGSATVVLSQPLEGGDDDRMVKSGGANDDAGGTALVNSEDHDDEDHDEGDEGREDRGRRAITEEERERIRAQRREERHNKKQLQRQRQQESNMLINALRKQNEELLSRVAQVEQRTSGAEIARLDKSIEDTQLRVEFARSKIQEAMNAQDGEAMVKAQEMLFENRRVLEQLSAMKNNMVQAARRPQQTNIQLPNHEVQNNAVRWMQKNKWYDPKLGDIDSRIARDIDVQLTNEGWDPSSKEYWEEMDERLSGYLPHRYKTRDNNDTGQDFDDSDSGRQQPTQRRRTMVTGTGREGTTGSSRTNEIVIDPERVKAMKEAGIWDDPKRRAAMIQKYAQYDRQQKRS